MAYEYRLGASTALAGTVATSGTTAVVGSGTAFDTALQAGDYLTIGAETRIVATVTDGTHLTVTVAYTPTASGLSAARVRPACPSRASGWSSLTTPRGFPCCVRFPCVHAVATTPTQRLGILFARFHNRISLPRKGRPVGLRNDLFEACSAFTHITACTLAGSPKATPYIGGFSHFVTSMTAPIASGRSDLAGWDFHPLEQRRLITANTQRSL